MDPRRTLGFVIVAVGALLPATAARTYDVLARGDVNGDGGVDISDCLALLGYLFQSGPASPCQIRAANVNEDNSTDIADAIHILLNLFVTARETPGGVTCSAPPRGACVVAYPGRVILPDGMDLDVSASRTDGLQEAIDFSAAGGWDLLVYPSSADGFFTPYRLERGLWFPSLQGKTIRVMLADLIFDSNVTGPAMEFDSTMMVDFEMTGRVIAPWSQTGVSFHPVTPHPLDGLLHGTRGVVDSRFRFRSIAAAQYGVHFLWERAPIVNSTFFFEEVDGGEYGITIGAADGGHCFCENFLRAARVHRQARVGLQFGQSTLRASALHDNRIEAVFHPDDKCPDAGLQLWGHGNTIWAAVGGSSSCPRRGISLESSAHDNRLVLGRVAAAVPLFDGSDRSNRVRDWLSEGCSF